MSINSARLAPLDSSTSARRLIGPLFVALYVLLSMHVMGVFVLGSDLGSDNSRPSVVQHRPLMYEISRAIANATPDVVRAPVTRQLLAIRDKQTTQRYLMIRYDDPSEGTPGARLSPASIYDTAVTMFSSWLSLLALIWMIHKLARSLFARSRACALLAPVLLLILLSSLVAHFGYSYDFAELFFATACLYLLFKQRWVLYLACVTVGTFNKETTIFAVILFAIWGFWHLPRRQYLLLLGAQLALFAMVRLITSWLYGPFDGYGEMLTFITAHWLYLYGFGYLSFLGFLATMVLLTYRWRDKPVELKWALWVVPANLAAYVMTGTVAEFRALYWSLPPLMLLGTHTLVSITQLDSYSLFSCVPKASAPADSPLKRL